jgi:hypothetical protein
MRKSTNLITVLAAFIVSVATLKAQDVDINVISQENGVVDGEWAKDAQEGTVSVLVSICNNSGGSTSVPVYKLRPLISVPSEIVRILPADKQTGIPAGWAIISLTDGSIRLTNGTDQIAAGDCREFPIFLQPIEIGGPSYISATMAFSTGVAPGTASGPQTVGNLPLNDNSATTVTITESLPVTLISFSVATESGVVLLNWSTSDETNSDRFEIQRSANGKNWSKIGSVASHGESSIMRNYAFTDKNPMSGENLYRLKMIDLDETFSFSTIRAVHFQGIKNAEPISFLYPNPSSDKVFLADASAMDLQSVTIVDMSGRDLITTNKFSEGIDVQSLPTGAYMLRITKKDEQAITHKFMIVK